VKKFGLPFYNRQQFFNVLQAAKLSAGIHGGRRAAGNAVLQSFFQTFTPR
jgi:hypothetical protein